MCLDCQELWQSFFRPVGPPSRSLLSGEFGASLRREHEIYSDSRGSTSGGLQQLFEEDPVNDVACGAATVVGLLERLSSGEIDEQREAAKELRLLAKEGLDRNIMIARAGSIPPLVDILATRDPETQEHAVTTLLNLSIVNANKVAIVRAGAVNAIVNVLKSGSMEARENAAATLFSLSVLDENKVEIGRSDALCPLVDLLRDGTMRAKNDAASVLFNLSLYEENKPTAVSAGIVPPLVELLTDHSACMVDISLAILSLLATHKDCKAAIEEASILPILVDLMRSGSQGNKENAAAVLLALGENDPVQAGIARQLGALPCAAELVKSGIPRSRKKTGELLDVLNMVEHHPQRHW